MHKKRFAAGLAVLMVLSMLACFVLPSSAANLSDNQHYYVRTAADWVELAKNTTAGYWTGKTIHLEKDIDFADVKVGRFPFTTTTNESYVSISDKDVVFTGTLDGHGHTIKNLTISGSKVNSGSLFYALGSGAVIKNVNLDSSCTFSNTYSSGAQTGAFAAISQGGTIYNCTSSATITATKGDHLGGFVGTANDGLTIDHCLFNGTVTSTNSGAASALVGYNNNTKPLKVYNTIAAGTINNGGVTNGTNTGMIRVYATMVDASALASNAILHNSYAVGMKAAHYNGTANETSSANFEAAHVMDDALKAGWTVNANRVATANPQVYFTADLANALANSGAKEERIVKVTTTNSGVSNISYYGPRMTNAAVLSTQTQITPEAVDGKTIEVTGAHFENGIIYLDYQDVLVNYVDNTTEDYKFNQAKAQLQELVDAYSAMDSKYFTNWSAKQNWLSGAKYTLSNATKASQLQTSISGEAALADGVASLTYPNYPSIKDYNVYKHIASIKDYAVGSAEEWLAAVEMSDFVHNDKAVTFSGITIHLTNTIDMGNAAMLPLCYGDICDADFNGHDFTFENVNIQINAPVGPVGLIAQLGKTKARTVYNLGIGSGMIHTDGIPRYKLSWSITDSGNKTGGICGRTNKNGAIFRKCWFGGEVGSSNRDSTAPIIADARHSVTLDSCFNIGKSNGTGISGYGQISEKVYNSFSGAVSGGAVNISLNTTKVDSEYLSTVDEICARFDTHFVNVYSVCKPLALTHISSDATLAAVQNEAGAVWNARYRVLSNAAAAWNVNHNYSWQVLGSGERIYFTLNEQGDVAFGKPDGSDQIRRITLKYGDQTRYLYAAAGSTITLSCPDADALDSKTAHENEFYRYNYFTPETKTTLSKIEGNQLTMGNEDITILAGKNIRRGDADNTATVNMRDGMVTVQKAVGKAVSINEMAADVDSNGAIEVKDALMMVREWLKGNKGDIFDSSLPTETRDDYIKICSYNYKSCHYDPYSTYSDGSDDSYNGGITMERYDDVVAEILKVNPDIIGLQEVDVNNYDSPNEDQLAKFEAELEAKNGIPYYSAFFCTVPDTTSDSTYGAGGGYGHGIISKYPIITSGIVEVRFAGMQNADGTRFDALEPRGFGKYPLDINGNGTYDVGTDIMFYNCHLAEITYQQLEFMADYMEADIDAGHKVVSAGDYNLQAFEMRGAFDTDKLTALNGGDRFNSYCITTDGGSMIDNIIVSDNLEYYWNEGMQTGVFSSNATYDYTINDRGNVVAAERATATASDHLAIWTYIKNPAK